MRRKVFNWSEVHWYRSNFFQNPYFSNRSYTGKSLLEAPILASTNPQYHKRLFIDLPVQYMKTTSSEHVVYINCSECQNKNKKQFVYTTCSELVVFMYWTGKSMNNLFVILWFSCCKNKCFWKRFTCTYLKSQICN